MNLDVVGLGALNMDYIYSVERILADGETMVNSVAKYPGGSAANTIYGLARLGVKTGFIGAVGDDDDGQILIGDFRKAGVDTSRIKIKSGAKTGSVLCLGDGRQRALYVSPGANSLLEAADKDASYTNSARILHASSFVDDRQFEVLLELVGHLGAGTKLSFSPGALYAAKSLTELEPVLARADILFANSAEVWQLTGLDVVPGAEACISRGCHLVAITLGGGKKLELTNGKIVEATTYIRDTSNEYIVESPDTTPVVDSTGAGDAFAAGFLYGLLNDKPALDCGRLGDITAHCCLGQSGAREGLPTLDWLSQRYQQLYGQKL